MHVGGIREIRSWSWAGAQMWNSRSDETTARKLLPTAARSAASTGGQRKKNSIPHPGEA